jgi:hypothetical protein
MAARLERPVDRLQVRRRIGDAFADVFGIAWSDRPDWFSEAKRPGSMESRLPGAGDSALTAVGPAAR